MVLPRRLMTNISAENCHVQTTCLIQTCIYTTFFLSARQVFDRGVAVVMSRVWLQNLDTFLKCQKMNRFFFGSLPSLKLT